MPRRYVRRRAPVRRRRLRGRGFFSSIGNFFKNTIKKPSTWLGGLSMLPTPLSIPLKIAGVASGLAGHGRRRRYRRRGGRRPVRTMAGSGRRRRYRRHSGRGMNYISQTFPMV